MSRKTGASASRTMAPNAGRRQSSCRGLARDGKNLTEISATLSTGYGTSNIASAVQTYAHNSNCGPPYGATMSAQPPAYRTLRNLGAFYSFTPPVPAATPLIPPVPALRLPLTPPVFRPKLPWSLVPPVPAPA